MIEILIILEVVLLYQMYVYPDKIRTLWKAYIDDGPDEDGEG